MRGKWLIVPLIALPLLIGGAWMWDRDWVYPYVAFILPIDAEPAAAIDELVLEEKIALGDVKGRIDLQALILSGCTRHKTLCDDLSSHLRRLQLLALFTISSAFLLLSAAGSGSGRAERGIIFAWTFRITLRLRPWDS